MEFIRPFIITIAKLLVLTSAGYLLFRSEFAQKKILKLLIWVTINILVPVYFIHSFSSGWKSAINTEGVHAISGGMLMAGFFTVSLIMIIFQGIIGWIVIYKTRLINTDHPVEMLTLFSISNCGFIPLPILKPIIPPAVMIYMFFYILAFNLILWSVAAPALGRVHGSSKPTHFNLNMPLAGLLSGLMIAILNLYEYLPLPIRASAAIISNASLDFILVTLGAILAGIQRDKLRHYSEFKWHIIIKMVLFPASILALGCFIPIHGVSTEISSAIKLIMVLEASMPPATTLMVICGRFGNRQQIDFMGSGIITTYFASIISVPVFLILAALLYY